jgi:hypothetical protein
VLAELAELRSLTLPGPMAAQGAVAALAPHCLARLTRLCFVDGAPWPLHASSLAPIAATGAPALVELCLPPAIIDDELLGLLGAGAPALAALTVSAGGAFTASHAALAAMAARCPLSSLAISCGPLDGLALAAALPALTRLTQLSLCLHRGTAAPVAAALLLPALQSLSIACHFSGLEPADLLAGSSAAAAAAEGGGGGDGGGGGGGVQQRTARLTTLELHNHWALPALKALLQRVGAGLQELRVSGVSELDDAGLRAAAAACPRLRTATLERLRGATPAGVAALAVAPALQRVSLLGCRNVPPDSTAVLAATLPPRVQLVQLR